jgi:glycogen debranching enzyme
MVACPIGSVRGYDQIVPQRIDLVLEKKWYPLENEILGSGMINARKVFNDLHRRLEEEGYSEQHTHQDGDMIVIQRHNPITHQAVYAACHTPPFLKMVKVLIGH